LADWQNGRRNSQQARLPRRPFGLHLVSVRAVDEIAG
jgi:hypothetical protein